MKRLLTLLAVAALGVSTAHAQKLQLGLKLGANFTQLDGKTWDNGYKTNLVAGAFVGVRALRFGVLGEVLFSQASYRTGNDFGTIYSDELKNPSKAVGDFRVNYVSIPVLLQVKLIGPLVLLAGPQYSGVINVNDKDELVKDAKAIFKSGSIDAVGGVLLELPMHLNAGARYIVGLSNINGINDAQDSWKQKALQIHVGYTF